MLSHIRPGSRPCYNRPAMSKKHSSQTRERKKVSPVRLAVVGTLVVVAAGTAIALTRQIDEDPPPRTAAEMPTVGTTGTGTSGMSGEVPAPPGITNPMPWQYDAATDRHYDPNHMHWHAGRPPAPGSRVASSGDQVPAPPGITNPTPWQFDATTNRHFDPNHGHWHSGPPPANR